VAGPAHAGQRPFWDFTSQQGAWCAVFDEEGIDCAASGYGGQACEDGFSYTFPQFWSDPKRGYTAGIDTLGQLDDGSFGTTVDGSVTESRMPDGSAAIKVVLHTANALTRVLSSDAGFVVFGYSRGEVFGGAMPVLGDVQGQISFRNTSPGAPLPDISQLLFCPEPGQSLEVFSVRARASGPLRAGFGVPEGTPGLFEMNQTGLIETSGTANPRSAVGRDAYPVESIILRATGK
jgi:hypothetical protein